MSPKLRNEFFLHKKLVIFFCISVFGEIQFSFRAVRKETKILKEGARGDRGSSNQNEIPIPDLSNAL